jgi:thymidine phosphorylase
MVRTGIASSHDQAENLIAEVIANGSALEKFKQMCIQQGVKEVIAQALIDNPNSVLSKSEHITEITVTEAGYVSDIDSMVLADIARKHGAGRFTIEDEIIQEIGFEICVERGQYVEAETNWLKFHHNQALSEVEIGELSNSLTISPHKIQVKPRLISIIE